MTIEKPASISVAAAMNARNGGDGSNAVAASIPLREAQSLNLNSLYQISLDDIEAQNALMIISETYGGGKRGNLNDTGRPSKPPSSLGSAIVASPAPLKGGKGKSNSNIMIPSPQEIRKDLEMRLVKAHDELLEANQNLYNELLEMKEAMAALNEDCFQIKESLDMAVQDTSEVVHQIQDLTSKRAQSIVKKQIATAFLARFTLNPRQIQILTNSSQDSPPINKEFFDALGELQRIHKDCNILLITEQQRAGLEIMEKMNMYQEIAYERLFKWTQHECRLMKYEAPEVSGELKRAMHAFRLRPILFDACIEEIASIRNQALGKAFYTALSVGGPGGFPKPIDFHAHDAQRYAGDILAWIHQACVGEREMLEAVFGVASRADRRRSSVTMPEAFQSIEGYKASEEAVLKVLDRNTEGLCSILMKRLDSLFASSLGCLNSFKIANMFQFYAETIAELLGSLSILTNTLERIAEKSVDAFKDSLKNQENDILRTIINANASLDVPQGVRDYVAQLKELLVSYDMSLVSSSHVERNKPNTSLIFEAFLDPLIIVCHKSAEELPPLDASIFLVNCYHLFRTCLSSFTGYIDDPLKRLEQLISEQVDALALEQYKAMIQNSGLANLLTCIDTSPVGQPLGLQANTDKAAVGKAMSSLNTFLMDVNLDVTENLYKIQSVDISKKVSSKGRIMFLESYKGLVEKIMDPANKYEFPTSLVTRTCQELDILFAQM